MLQRRRQKFHTKTTKDDEIDIEQIHGEDIEAKRVKLIKMRAAMEQKKKEKLEQKRLELAKELEEQRVQMEKVLAQQEKDVKDKQEILETMEGVGFEGEDVDSVAE